MCTFLKEHLMKEEFYLLACLKQMPLFVISDESIFFKTEVTRLCPIVVLNKGLQKRPYINQYTSVCLLEGQI